MPAIYHHILPSGVLIRVDEGPEGYSARALGNSAMVRPVEIAAGEKELCEALTKACRFIKKALEIWKGFAE
jgi:hypothetical protein